MLRPLSSSKYGSIFSCSVGGRKGGRESLAVRLVVVRGGIHTHVPLSTRARIVASSVSISHKRRALTSSSVAMFWQSGMEDTSRSTCGTREGKAR